MSEVPERGRPDTMMISLSTRELLHCGRIRHSDQIFTFSAPRKQKAATIETTNQ